MEQRTTDKNQAVALLDWILIEKATAVRVGNTLKIISKAMPALKICRCKAVMILQ